MGIDPHRIETTGEWVNAPCPLAPWTHSGGADTRPSFGVRINNEGVSHYYCFGCMPEGRTIDWLLHTWFVATGRYPIRAAKIFGREEYHYFEGDEEVNLKATDVWDIPEGALPILDPLSVKVTRQYKLLQSGTGFEARRCREYLEGRGIPTYIANYAGVRYDKHNRTLIFPMTDRRGRIFLLRARSRLAKKMWTINPKKAGFPDMKFPRLRDVGVWFGMWLVDWKKPVWAVEGELDALRLMALGEFNVVASATSSVSDSQIDNLLMARTVILGYDADKGGDRAVSRIKHRGDGRSVLYQVDWKEVGRKDPGELESKAELVEVKSSLKIP